MKLKKSKKTNFCIDCKYSKILKIGDFITNFCKKNKNYYKLTGNCKRFKRQKAKIF